MIGWGSHVAAEVRAAAIAVVDVAVGGVGEGSVEIVAGTLSVELSGAVSQVKLLDNSEHDVVCYNGSRSRRCPPKKTVWLLCTGKRQACNPSLMLWYDRRCPYRECPSHLLRTHPHSFLHFLRHTTSGAGGWHWAAAALWGSNSHSWQQRRLGQQQQWPPPPRVWGGRQAVQVDGGGGVRSLRWAK